MLLSGAVIHDEIRHRSCATRTADVVRNPTRTVSDLLGEPGAMVARVRPRPFLPSGWRTGSLRARDSGCSPGKDASRFASARIVPLPFIGRVDGSDIALSLGAQWKNAEDEPSRSCRQYGE
jgi:hypothetical protein